MKYLLIILSFFFSSCMSLFYYPDQKNYLEKQQIPYPTEEGFFSDTLGNQIHYWYSSSSKPIGKVLFFHGNAQNLSAHFMMLAWLLDHHYDLMIFDYPGYGKSSGVPTPESTVRSGVAAIEKANQFNPHLPLILYGQSLGGQILQKSVNLTHKIDYKMILLEGTFSSYKSVARNILERHWLTWLFQPIGWIVMSDSWAGDPALISPKPIYIIHGKEDAVVPYEQGIQLYNKALSPKVFLPIEKGGHGNLYHIEQGQYRKNLLDILKK